FLTLSHNAIFAATGQRLYNLPFPTSFAKA
ncbi:hypothetical protein, partial [Pseudomonas aeruginosa]